MSQVKAPIDPLFSVSSDDEVREKIKGHLARSLRFMVSAESGYAAFQHEGSPWKACIVDLSTGEGTVYFNIEGPAKPGLHKPSREQWRKSATRHLALTAR